MQAELLEKIRTRDRHLGQVLLSIVAMVYLASAFFVYPRFVQAGSPSDLYIALTLLGAMAGTVLAIFTWFCLSVESLLRRFLVALSLTAVTTALWCLGFLSTLDQQSDSWALLSEPLLAAAFLPMLFFGLLVPLISFRILSASVLSSRWEPVPQSRGYSLTDMLVWITLAAILAWSIKSVFQGVEDWRAALRFFGFLFGIAFAFSAGVLVVGSTLWFSASFSWVISGLVTVSCFLALGGAAGFWMRPSDKLGMLLLFGVASIALLATVGGLRLLGYRRQTLSTGQDPELGNTEASQS